MLVQPHNYQFEYMMEPAGVLSGHGLNPSRIQDWFGGKERFTEVESLVDLAENGVSVCVRER